MPGADPRDPEPLSAYLVPAVPSPMGKHPAIRMSAGEGRPVPDPGDGPLAPEESDLLGAEETHS